MSSKKPLEGGTVEEVKLIIKDKCSWCGKPISTKESYHIERGNCCRDCSAMAGIIVKGVTKVTITKSGKIRETKARDYTDGEKDEFIKRRLIKLNEQHEENKMDK